MKMHKPITITNNMKLHVGGPGDNLRREQPKHRAVGSGRPSGNVEQQVFLQPLVVTFSLSESISPIKVRFIKCAGNWIKFESQDLVIKDLSHNVYLDYVCSSNF